MNKEKVYITVIVLLAIALIVGCVLQAQQAKKLSVSEIIVPKQGLVFKNEDGKVILKITDVAGGNLTVYNHDEKPVAEMYSFIYGGTIAIKNHKGKSLASMFAMKDYGMMIISSEKGNIIWSKP